MSYTVRLNILKETDDGIFLEAKSFLSGKFNRMLIPGVTTEDLTNWKKRKLKVQDAFPRLTHDQREFLLTGATREEWDEHYREHDEDETLFDDFDDDVAF